MSKNSSMSSHQWDNSLDPQISPLFLYLQWAQAKSVAIMQPLLMKNSISLAEFDVLATLRNAPFPHQMTPSQIQDEVVITSGGLSKVMTQLENRGLVVRLQSQEDLRIKPICLTETGKKQIETAMCEMIAVSGKWFRNALNSQEIQQLTSLLKMLADKQ